MTHRAPIVIEPYRETWPQVFETERAALRSVLTIPSVQIEHIGSTAVPGLAAKPIIDVMLGAASLADIESQIPALSRLGYVYVRELENELPERRFFAKPRIHPRQIHLHAVVFNEEFWIPHLAFRDALRANPDQARAYEALKRALAQVHGDDRESYTRAKGEFILALVNQALA